MGRRCSPAWLHQASRSTQPAITTEITKHEAVRNHEIDKRVVASLVAGVLDRSHDKERLRQADLRGVIRWPVGQVRRVAVRREPPKEPDLRPTPSLQRPCQEGNDGSDGCKSSEASEDV